MEQWCAGIMRMSKASPSPSSHSSTGMALIHRSEVYARSKCYAQAGADAAAAVLHFESSRHRMLLAKQCNPDALIATHVDEPGTTSPFKRAPIDPLAWAWYAIDAVQRRTPSLLTIIAQQVCAWRGVCGRGRPPRPGLGRCRRLLRPRARLRP